MKSVGAVLLGGGIGSLARYLAGHYLPIWLGTAFPWATLFVNVAGSMCLGFIGTLAIQKPGVIDPTMRLLLTAGFAGGFTTFSTFTFETLLLYERGSSLLALANIGSNLVIGFMFVWLGAILARLL
jgi:CrcB protein